MRITLESLRGLEYAASLLTDEHFTVFSMTHTQDVAALRKMILAMAEILNRECRSIGENLKGR
jgi:hypothetical protein